MTTPAHHTPLLPLLSLLPLLLFLLLLPGCNWREGDQPMRIGSNAWPGYEPLYLARDLGYFQRMPVALKEYPSSSAVIRAFRNGALEGACLTMDEVLLLQQSGFDLRVILVMDISHGGDVIMAHPGMTILATLKGRRVGFENTALGAYVLSRALEQAGLALADLEAIPMPVDEHRQAFLEGRVDAVVTFEPVRSQLLAAGAAILFDSTRIPGEVVDVLVVRAAYAEAHPQLIRQLLTQWFRALAFLRDSPQQAQAHLVKRLKVTPEAARGLFSGMRLPSLAENRQLLIGAPATLQDNTRRLHDTMLALHLLQEAVPYPALFRNPPLAGM